MKPDIKALEKEREEAYQKHVAMWTAMKEKLGDTPETRDRAFFKSDYTIDHGDFYVKLDCYLCDFVDTHGLTCKECPVDWKADPRIFRVPECQCETDWRSSPISQILALPERKYV